MRSMVFSSSRMLPGHWYSASASIASGEMRLAAGVELLEEVRDEQRDVAGALAQRRQRDRHDVEPVEEVLAERRRRR